MNEGLAFQKGLVERFIQFKMIQQRQQQIEFQNQLMLRREARYERQLEDQQLYNQRRLDQFEEALKISKIRAKQAPISFEFGTFSPSQISGTANTQGIDDIIAEELSNIPRTSERKWWRFDSDLPDKININDVAQAKKNAISKLGVAFMGTAKKEQFEFLFNQQLDELLNPEDGRKTIVTGEEKSKSGTLFKNNSTKTNINNEDMSNISEEELKRIAGIK